MNIDLGKLAAWSVLGAGLGVLVALVAAGQASQRMFATVLNQPTQWLTTPALIGAACGAAIAFIKK